MEKRDSRKTSFIEAGTTDAGTLQLKVTKLVEGNEYFFQVIAENNIGQSDPAVTDEPVKARLPFGMILHSNMGFSIFHQAEHHYISLILCTCPN